MVTISLLLFASVLLLLAAAATRGLLHIDEILKVVEPPEADPESTHPLKHAER
ncbi:MAG: hypothetical protein GVY18_00395 [Bacteroidetes bacterium]|nr:hypothetical protein [Bacteroidota bacterium]